MAWLSGWAKRVKLTIDQGDITAALANFPILLCLSTSSGRSPDDISFIFDELISNDNRKKIAVTTSDGETECYVEIEKWDDASEEAWLWAKVPSIASDADTDLYLYYDIEHAENDAYVGDCADGSAPTHAVWASNFKAVHHMRDDPDTSHIKDSTSQNQDGTKEGPALPSLIQAGQIGEAQDFERDSEASIDCGAIDMSGSAITISAWVKLESYAGISPYITSVVSVSGTGLPPHEYVVLRIGKTGDPDIPQFVLNIADVGYGVLTGSIPFSLATWYYLVGTYDGSYMRIYVNGAIDTNTEQTGLIVADAFLQLGTTVINVAVRWMDGVIDEARIADACRSAAWIKACYESERDDLLNWGSEETPEAKVSFSATVSASSASPDDANLNIERLLSAVALSVSAAPDDAVLGVLLQLSATTIVAASATPDDIALQIHRAFSATALAASVLPDDVVLAVKWALSAVSLAGTSTPDAVILALLHAFQATLSASSAAPDDADLQIAAVAFQAAMLASSATPDDALLLKLIALQAVALIESSVSDLAVLAILAAVTLGFVEVTETLLCAISVDDTSVTNLAVSEVLLGSIAISELGG